MSVLEYSCQYLWVGNTTVVTRFGVRLVLAWNQVSLIFQGEGSSTITITTSGTTCHDDAKQGYGGVGGKSSLGVLFENERMQITNREL